MAKVKLKIVIALNLLLLCDLAYSAAPAQAYVNMRNGMCKSRSMSGALPYVTNRMIPYVNQMIQMETMMKGMQNYQDTFAKQCYSGIKILNEIPVSNQRYIIRYVDSDGSIKEVPVTLESGAWKVDVPN
jgi:hypothetical protein